jgi:hypothetical protein
LTEKIEHLLPKAKQIGRIFNDAVRRNTQAPLSNPMLTATTPQREAASSFDRHADDPKKIFAFARKCRFMAK